MNKFRKIFTFALLIGLLPLWGTQIASAATPPIYTFSTQEIETALVNQPITGITIINTGGDAVTSYMLYITYTDYSAGNSDRYAVPTGMSFDTATGAFSGTPTIAYGQMYIYVYAKTTASPSGTYAGMVGRNSFSLRVVSELPKTPQTITFAQPTAMIVGGTQTVSPTASSGLEVTLSAGTPARCTVSGFVITAVAAGNCSVTASQIGNGTYEAKSQARNFVISGGVTAPPTAEQIAAAAAQAAQAAAAAQAAFEAATAEAARVRAIAVAEAKTALNSVLVGSSAPSIEQYRAADYTITTQASFDRVTAAVAKLSVSERQDAAKLSAIIRAIELDESFFNVSTPPSIHTYSNYGVWGVTARTLSAVNAQVLQLPDGDRTDVAAIQQIAATVNFVDQIANSQTRGSVSSSVFVARGLVAADNPYKEALVVAAQALLAKLDETLVDTLEEITAIVSRVNAIALTLPVADRTDPSKIAAAIIEESKKALNTVLAGSTPPTIEQYRSANYAITTKASFDRISAAVAKLPVAERQDAAKLAALIKAIELDESFFNSSARPSLNTYKDYGVAGVTDRTLPIVNAQVLLLPIAERSDVVAIQKIAEVANLVDQIANPQTRGSATVSTFVSRGLIESDNPNKESVIAGLRSFDEYSLNTLAKVATVIKAVNEAVLALPVDERTKPSSVASVSAKLATIQTFVDRVSNIQSRHTVFSRDFIIRNLMPSDTPYKYSVVLALQGYSEDSLDSLEKIASVIKTEITKAQQRNVRLSALKASIAAKRK